MTLGTLGTLFHTANTCGMWMISYDSMCCLPSVLFSGTLEGDAWNCEDAQAWCRRLIWAERWRQDVPIYSTCYCDLQQQQQSDCCGDPKKQSAAHPHAAGSCWTKDDYLYWYKKHRILFLKLKIDNIYSKWSSRYIWADKAIVCFIFLRRDNHFYL